SFDQDLGINIDRNVGAVTIRGVDAELSWRPSEHLYLYTSVSYNHSEIKKDFQLGTVTVGGTAYPFFLPIAGKQIVETPDWTWFRRLQSRGGGFTAGAQFKYVGRRFATDLNDEIAPAYTTVDFDLRYDLSHLGLGHSRVQLNVTNFFNEKYFAGVSTTRNNASNVVVPVVGAPGNVTTTVTGLAPAYTVGAPRTVQVSLVADF